MTDTPDDATSQMPVRHGPRLYKGDRLIGLSDGVFAFAITLLVLDLVVPSLKERDIMGELLGEWPQFLAYIISFATIGAVWLAHSAVTDQMVRTDSVFARLNLLVLLMVSFMPYPTRLLSIFISSEAPERIAVVLYGATVLVLVGLLYLLWAYAKREGHFDPEADEGDLALFTRRMIPGMAAYVALIAIGWFVPLVAIIGYALIAVYFIVPFRIRNLRHKTA